MTTTTNQSNYFNLTARGFGYLGRIRTVAGGKGKNAYSYNAVSINAMCGESDAVEYVRFELEPKSAQAKAVVDWLMTQETKDKKVLMAFECGDLSPYHFTYNEKEYDAIKGRLLKISSLKIDGEVIDLNAIYHVEPTANAVAQQDARPQAQQRQAA
jgi:hypothetical protein